MVSNFNHLSSDEVRNLANIFYERQFFDSSEANEFYPLLLSIYASLSEANRYLISQAVKSLMSDKADK